MARDMTQHEFERACDRHGFRPQPLGYYGLGRTPVAACKWNAGRRRRDQLAYLIREHGKACEKYASES